jgi:hypothetical protein
MGSYMAGLLPVHPEMDLFNRFGDNLLGALIFPTVQTPEWTDCPCIPDLVKSPGGFLVSFGNRHPGVYQ